MTIQRNTLQHIFHAWQQNRYTASFNSYQLARKEYKKAIVVAKKKHLSTFLESISELEIFQWASKDKGFATMLPPLQGRTGLVSNWEEKSELLFRTLNKAKPEKRVHILEVDLEDIPEISLAEIKRHLWSLSVKKAPGIDTLPYSILKSLFTEKSTVLYWIFHYILR